MDGDMVPLRDICDTSTVVAFPTVRFRRDLEYFEGSILSEYYRFETGSVYLHKWCDCAKDRRTNRYLMVESNSYAIDDYVKMKISMYDLLTRGHSQVFLVDYGPKGITDYGQLHISSVPEIYMPQKSAMHNPDLRPGWDRN